MYSTMKISHHLTSFSYVRLASFLSAFASMHNDDCDRWILQVEIIPLIKQHGIGQICIMPVCMDIYIDAKIDGRRPSYRLAHDLAISGMLCSRLRDVLTYVCILLILSSLPLGYATFFSGVSVGVTNIASGYVGHMYRFRHSCCSSIGLSRISFLPLPFLLCHDIFLSTWQCGSRYCR